MRFGLVQAGVPPVPRLGRREESDGSLLGRGAGALSATVAEGHPPTLAVGVAPTARRWLTAQLAVEAAVTEGNIVRSFSSFGFERLAGDGAVAVIVAVEKDRVFL